MCFSQYPFSRPYRLYLQGAAGDSVRGRDGEVGYGLGVPKKQVNLTKLTIAVGMVGDKQGAE